jgi:hypothetical protein
MKQRNTHTIGGIETLGGVGHAYNVRVTIKDLNHITPHANSFVLGTVVINNYLKSKLRERVYHKFKASTKVRQILSAEVTVSFRPKPPPSRP